MYEGIKKEPLSFKRGVDKRQAAELLKTGLKRRINEIVDYQETLRASLKGIYNSDERQAVRDKLKALSDHALRGAELIGTSRTDEIKEFLDVDYKNLK